MDGLVLLIGIGLGWLLAGDPPSPATCPPPEYPQPPAALMVDPPTLYLLPPELRTLPLDPRTWSTSRSAAPTLTASSRTGLQPPSR